MEGLLKRHFWLIDLLLIAGIAYTTVRVANLYLLKEMQAILSVSEPSVQKIQIKPNEASQKDWASVISGRNLFNANPPSPEQIRLQQEAEEQKDKAEEEEVPTGRLPEAHEPCDESSASLTLRFTMIAEEASESYAIIDDGKGERIFRQEDTIDSMKIASIQWNGDGGRVVFQKKGKYECISSGPNKGKNKKSAKSEPEEPPPVAEETKPSVPSDDKFKDGIKEIEPGKYQVDRAMLDEQIADLDNLMRQARVIPHYKQGKPAGFKVVGVRSNSIFRHLGLKSGDVLKSVGGEELTSINKALGLFEALKTNSNVSLDIERQGKPSNLEYNIK
jgi:general secretion pathway protein C